MRRKYNLLSMILILGVVFALGIFIGNVWSVSQTTEISKFLRQSELNTESFLVEQDLFERFDINCELGEKRIDALSNQLWNLGKLLNEPGAKAELGEENYFFLKQKFHLMQIRTYILSYKLQPECGKHSNMVLYYFKQGDKLSEEQGRVLDSLVEEYNIHVFAIEYEYSTELAFLEDYYEIKNTPTLVINFEHVLDGLATNEQIVPLLHESQT